MCHCLYQVLSKRFPQVPHSNVSSVGTVIFLRFINPAIGEHSCLPITLKKLEQLEHFLQYRLFIFIKFHLKNRVF